MSKIRLDELKKALLKRAPAGGKSLSEADYKRKLVAEVKALGGQARRVEDRFGVGVLDLTIKLPEHPVILAEGKLIHGNLFGPTERQFEEGEKWIKAGVGVVLIGWQFGVMYVSPWIEKADYRHCFTRAGLSDAEILREYLR